MSVYELATFIWRWASFSAGSSPTHQQGELHLGFTVESGLDVGRGVANEPTPAAFGRHPSREGIPLGEHYGSQRSSQSIPCHATCSGRALCAANAGIASAADQGGAGHPDQCWWAVWLGLHQDHHQRTRTLWNRIGQQCVSDLCCRGVHSQASGSVLGREERLADRGPVAADECAVLLAKQHGDQQCAERPGYGPLGHQGQTSRYAGLRAPRWQGAGCGARLRARRRQRSKSSGRQCSAIYGGGIPLCASPDGGLRWRGL